MVDYNNLVNSIYNPIITNTPETVSRPQLDISFEDIKNRYMRPETQSQSPVSNANIPQESLSDVYSKLTGNAKKLAEEGLVKSNSSPQTISDNNDSERKTLGGFVRNTLVNRPLDLFTGLAYSFAHPIDELGRPLVDYSTNKVQEVMQGKNPLLAGLEVARDVSDVALYKPLTGQSISQIVEDPKGALKRYGQHIYEGGLADTAMILGPTGAGRATGRVIGKGISKLDDLVAKGAGKDLLKVNQAKTQLLQDTVLDKIETSIAKDKFKADLRDLYKNYNVSDVQLSDLIKKMEGFEGKSLADLTPEQTTIYNQFKPLLDEWDALAQKYTTATPENITEIVTRGVRNVQNEGRNTTYRDVDNLYKQEGLYDYGQYVNKETGEIVKNPVYKAEQNPSEAISQLGEPQSYPTLQQIYRRNGMTDKFNYDMALKKVEREYAKANSTNPYAQLDYDVSKADLMYKKIIKDTIQGDRDSLIAAETSFDEVLKQLPEEYKESFAERFVQDLEDIRGSKYSKEPVSDIGNPQNVNRGRSLSKAIRDARKYNEIKNATTLDALPKRLQRIVREHLTPEEFTDFLEGRATLGEVRQYVNEVAQYERDLKFKPQIAEDAITGKPVEVDLRNTRFEIPEENLDALAARALDDPVAKEFYDSYMLAKEGKLQRISHGLAEVNHQGVIPPGKGKINAADQRFNERIYGNARAEDIAKEWTAPDEMLNRAVRGLIRDKQINKFFDEYTTTGKPIMSKVATPEDIRYVSRETLGNSTKLKNLNNEGVILKNIPEGVNPTDYIAIDKYTLQAFKDLFYPNQSPYFKVPAWLKDLTSNFKQGLISSGIYLGGNFFGGLHSFITNSNLRMFEDISDAIKTKGGLIKQLGTYREKPTLLDTSLRFRSDKTPLGEITEKALKGGKTLNVWTGTNLVRTADTFLQNIFAELDAHAAFRKAGVPFENRNMEWVKNNMSKEQIYNILNDVEKAAMIYGDITLMPKWLIDLGETVSPFIRWVDQATQSSYWLMKHNPVAYAYTQGAVLGGWAWDRNKALAEGLDISNPLHGKIYRVDKNGNNKVTETEIVPILTSIKASAEPERYLEKFGTNATIQWAIDNFSAKDKYGRIKERSDWKDITPDFRKQVRYKDGIIDDNAEIDEMIASFARGIPGVGWLNKTAIPATYNAIGKEVYQPYNNQVFASPHGNPNKPYGTEEIGARLKTEYTHDIRPGVDTPMDIGSLSKLNIQAQKRRSKAEVAAEQAKKLRGRE